MNIINNKQDISNYKICNYGDEKIGILVMKYYKLGCVNDYEWNENNFNILKNIIKQVVFAVIQAYKIKGFIHGDLHCGNVLLKSKRNCIILYEDKTLGTGPQLHRNVCNSYPEFNHLSTFDISEFCLNELGYSRIIRQFNNSEDNLLIP
jgi:hypothetical protein